ncbi:hypothetical protein [Nocardioides sp.]|uniref:hypothetical protein n=1 Tax=Nocardioides sp. TaxID=35761 RepID=UPI0025E18EAD|nr:hypothetical protein [Nocardioides sp.]
MKTIPALVLAAVVSIGLLGGVAAYQLASGPAGPSPSPSAAAVAPVEAAAPRTHSPRPKVRWAPCKPPAVRHGKACVTEQVRTVVVPAPAPAAPRSTGTRPAAAAQPVRADGGEDGADHEKGEDHAEHADHEDGDHADDHADEDSDDHGDDHGEDHGDDDGEHEDD